MASLLSRPSSRAIQPENFTDAVDRTEFLQVHLNILKPRIRAALISWSEGKTNQEIADAAGVTETCVRKWVRQGLEQIRQHVSSK